MRSTSTPRWRADPCYGIAPGHTSEADAQAAFATLAPFRGGGIFAGSFSGESPWERHVNGDELVHILDGATTVTIIIDNEPRVFEMSAGMLVVVPQGCCTAFSPGTASPS